MKSLNMVYALKNGKTVHISEVVSGEKCGCICPACGEIMIAKKGSKVIHHFAHKSTIECEYGYQTSLHLAAKEIISKSKHICLPALYLTFSGSGRKMLLMDAQSVCVFDVILEKRINDIIPDILLKTDIGMIIVEIFVTHEIDDVKKRKIKRLDIPTIEINLSKYDRAITNEELEITLIKENENKQWIYNGKREQTYKRFVEVSEYKDIIVRNYALHVDNCPIKRRIWKWKPYANFNQDCESCDYFIDYIKIGGGFSRQEKILCSGKMQIGCLEDFDISTEERIQKNEEKREEEKYDLINQGICPQCGYQLDIKHGKYGEFFGCSNYPHCQFTFSYKEK